jgi:hypothetical protein
MCIQHTDQRPGQALLLVAVGGCDLPIAARACFAFLVHSESLCQVALLAGFLNLEIKKPPRC